MILPLMFAVATALAVQEKYQAGCFMLQGPSSSSAPALVISSIPVIFEDNVRELRPGFPAYEASTNWEYQVRTNCFNSTLVSNDVLESIKLYVDFHPQGSYATAVTVTAGASLDPLLGSIDFFIPTNRSELSCGGTRLQTRDNAAGDVLRGTMNVAAALLGALVGGRNGALLALTVALVLSLSSAQSTSPQLSTIPYTSDVSTDSTINALPKGKCMLALFIGVPCARESKSTRIARIKPVASKVQNNASPDSCPPGMTFPAYRSYDYSLE